MIVEELLRSAEGELRERRVEEIRVGLGYTAVKLDSGACGLAATIRDEISSCCTAIEEAGNLGGNGAYSIAELALSTDALKSTVGVATINALLNSRALDSLEGDILDHLQVTKDDTVGMVGYFGPLVNPIRARCRKLYIFERSSLGSENVYPDWAAEMLLPKCTIALITGTTLINKTIDHLLRLCMGVTAIAGPTTPFSTLFAEYGVNFLFGMKVQEADRVLQIVSEGGGTTAFGSAVSKAALKL